MSDDTTVHSEDVHKILSDSYPQETDVSKSPYTATNFLCFKSNKCKVIENLQEGACVMTVWFCDSVCEAVGSGEVHPLLTYFTNTEWFYLHSHTDTQNNRYELVDNPRLIHVMCYTTLTL
jgi:hypothetical protein